MANRLRGATLRGAAAGLAWRQEVAGSNGDTRYALGSVLDHVLPHGHFDMAAYDRYLSGELEDFAYPDERVRDALTRLPQVNL